MAGVRSTKDKEMASYLKKKGIQRTSATHCPFGCRKEISVVSSAPLLAHMMTCRGKSRGTRVTRYSRMAA